MARVNVYADIDAEGRQDRISIGGRRKQNWIKAWFNAATGKGDVDLWVKAEVWGEKTRKADERQVEFTVELPPADNPSVRVVIQENNAGLKAMARIGGMLVALKGILMMNDDRPLQEQYHGEYLVEQAAEVLESLKLKMDDVPPNVTIMGQNLRHLLACSAMVEMMIKENKERHSGEN